MDVKVDRVEAGLAYYLIPLIIVLAVGAFMVVSKLTEKSVDAFASWTAVVLTIVITAAVSIGLSIVVYLLFSMKNTKSGEREFNGREFCESTIETELLRKTGYRVGDFTKSGDSAKAYVFAGKGGLKDRDKFFYHLMRINEGSKSRYLLAVMNMEKGKEDDIGFFQSPMNLQNIYEFVDECVNRMCVNPVVKGVRQVETFDELSGRMRKERTEQPLWDDEGEEGEKEVEKVRA